MQVFLSLSHLWCHYLLQGFFAGDGVIGDALNYAILFLFYLTSYFVIVFFNVGLVYCAHIRIKGGDPTFRDGLNAAFANIGKIFMWALISATVGMILNILSRRAGVIGRIVISLIGMAWTLLTFFVVPAMIIEKRSVKDSISKSGALFKKTWGENVVGQFQIGLIFFILSLFGLIFPIIGLLTGNGILFIAFLGIAFFYWVLLGIINSSLDGIFKTALYEYATTGVVPAGFSDDTIKNAYRHK